MLKRYEKYMKVYSPTTDEGKGEGMGYYPVSLTFRTSEEVEAGDVLYTNLRYTAYGRRHRAPAGGYRRGMILEDADGGEYHVLVPTLVEDLWILKVERVMQNGEG